MTWEDIATGVILLAVGATFRPLSWLGLVGFAILAIAVIKVVGSIWPVLLMLVMAPFVVFGVLLLWALLEPKLTYKRSMSNRDHDHLKESLREAMNKRRSEHD